ncbi:MAG: hypothetical protein V3V72_13560 [Ignavibacteriaceae bacterium]
MSKIEKYLVLKEKETGVLWVLIEKKDLHNCRLEPVNIEGSWLACLDKDCPDNDLKVIEFMS